MEQNIFKWLQSRITASQLRKPRGFLAKKVGEKMYENNKARYDLTIDAMQLKDNESILEIGFGNGKSFDTIFSKAKQLKVFGIDFSKEMVHAARKNNSKSILSNRLNLQIASSDNIPYPDNYFDKALCLNLIYFWEHPDSHLKEIYRVLKPNGKFYTGIGTKESMLKLPFVNFGLTLYSKEEWISVLEQNNFKYVGASTKNDPEVEINGVYYNLESICIISEK
jgi:ubiquinone/menaquinone biosynthesis C-methylase UbiE